MKLDHVAIAVRSLTLASERLCPLLGYERDGEGVTNSRQDVRVLFLKKAESLPIKLIEPASDQSPLWDFVRKGGGLHHVCFKAGDVSAAVTDLTSQGARLLAGPQPGEAFANELIAFVYAGFGLNVEIIDTDLRGGRQETKA